MSKQITLHQAHALMAAAMHKDTSPAQFVELIERMGIEVVDGASNTAVSRPPKGTENE